MSPTGSASENSGERAVSEAQGTAGVRADNLLAGDIYYRSRWAWLHHFERAYDRMAR